MKYLLITYDNSNYKAHYFYNTLEEIKLNHGITSTQSVMDRLHIAYFNSGDGSGSYLIEYDKMEYLFIEYGETLQHFVDIIEKSKDFIKSDIREMKLNELNLMYGSKS